MTVVNVLFFCNELEDPSYSVLSKQSTQKHPGKHGFAGTKELSKLVFML
jgi:hypothetical protein